jgi:hypothetical protein
VIEPENPFYRYKSKVEECQVKNCPALRKYRNKRYEWFSWYLHRTNEPNSIERQIASMTFSDVAYRTLAEPRRDPNEDSNLAAKNGLLVHLLDQGYVATQILAIRRLLDTRPDVISVRRLLDDICKHRTLLTREIYVCYDGLPYTAKIQTANSQLGFQPPEVSKHINAHIRHEQFDALSRVSPSERKRDDLIKESVFQNLRQRLETSLPKQLVLLSHKFFAHAADLNSRGNLRYVGLLLADIAEAQKTIIQVEREIRNKLLVVGVATDVVPMPPLGFLKGLDNPYASTDSITRMQEYWDQLVKERDEW